MHNTLPRLPPNFFPLLQPGSFPHAQVVQGKIDPHGLSTGVSFLLDISAPVWNPPWEISAPPWSLPQASGLYLLCCLLPSPSPTLVSAASLCSSPFFPHSSHCTADWPGRTGNALTPQPHSQLPSRKNCEVSLTRTKVSISSVYIWYWNEANSF